ncbi:MAG TPA: hypothetical protein VL947_09495 [Cytophagales bacterium]|nr:hypothetical protein [Cytophagales bacterium]
MLIGITGCSGSGKSMFVRLLQKHLSTRAHTIFTQDNYYINRHLQPKDHNGVHNFDLPESLDLQHYYEDLKKLKEGQPVTQQRYNYNNPTLPSALIELKPYGTLITEGLFVFHDPRYLPLFDIKVFIESSQDVNFARRLYRDETERGYGYEDVNYRFHEHVMPSYLKYIIPQKAVCDVVIDNEANDPHGLDQAAQQFVAEFIINKKSKSS